MKHLVLRRIVAFVLALAMFFSFSISIFAANMTETTFRDVKPSAWYYEGVRFVYNNGIMSGQSADTFAPNALTTRAMFVTVLYNLDGSNQKINQSLFIDVKPSAWYYDAVNWAFVHGIVSGFNGEVFLPSEPVTREQLAVMLYRFACYKDYDITASGDLYQFPDSDLISNWGWTAMNWAVGNKLIAGSVSGDSVLINPQGWATRAQLASILQRFCYQHNIGEQYTEPVETTKDDDFFGIVPNPNNYVLHSNGRISYPNALSGIDVSDNQGEINWKKVAADGIDFAIIRCGLRAYVTGSLSKDSYFKKNYDEAKAAGLKVGVYFFSQAITVKEAEEEARKTLEYLDGRTLDYPVYFDWEVNKSNYRTYSIMQKHPERVAEFAKAYCDIVRAGGYVAGLYSNPALLNQMDRNLLTNIPIWLAHWVTAKYPVTDFDLMPFGFWQYEARKVDGITGLADMNLHYIS